MKNFNLKLIRGMLLLLGLLCVSVHSIGQSSLTTFKLDFKTGKVEPSDLPFDVPFVITGTLDKNSHDFELSYVELTEKQLLKLIQPGGKNCNCPTSYESIHSCLGEDCSLCKKLCVQLSPGENNTTLFSAVVPPLKPNRYYVFLSKSKRNPPGVEETAELQKIVSSIYLNDLDRLYSINPDPNMILNAYTEARLDSLRVKTEAGISGYYASKGYTSMTFPSRDQNFLRAFAANALVIEEYVGHRDQIHNYQDNYSNSVQPSLITLRGIPTFSSLLNNGVTLRLSGTTIQLMQNIHLDAPEADLFFVGLVDGNGKRLSTMQENDLRRLSAEDIGKILANLKAARTQVQDCRQQLAVLSTDVSLAQLLITLGITVDSINHIIGTLDSLSMGMNAEIVTLTTLLNARQNLDQQLKVATNRFIPTLNLGASNFGFVSAEFKARAEWYIVPDIGVAWSSIPGDPGFVSYAGVNFNLWPINRQHKYSLFDRSTWRGWWRTKFYKNFSIVIGLTTKNLTVESTRISGALNNKGLLIGGALRLNDYVRFSYGALLFRQQINPLQAEKKVYVTPFIALSLDLDVKKQLGDLSSLLN